MGATESARGACMSYNDIQDRYRYIRPVLEKYKRPFSLLDIGAFHADFSFQIARDFPQATCIAIEQDSYILNVSHEANLPNVIVLNHRMSAEDIVSLSRCCLLYTSDA